MVYAAIAHSRLLNDYIHARKRVRPRASHVFHKSDTLQIHSVVTHIGSVTRDQKVPGSNPVGWLLRCGHIPVVPNWFNKGLVVCITVYGSVHLKDPLESVEKSRDRLPAPGFCLSPICP